LASAELSYYTFDDAASLPPPRADITGFVSRLEKRAILMKSACPELFAALKSVVDANPTPRVSF